MAASFNIVIAIVVAFVAYHERNAHRRGAMIGRAIPEIQRRSNSSRRDPATENDQRNGAQGRNRTTDTAIFRLIFREHGQQDRKLELSNRSTRINKLPWICLTVLGHHGPAGNRYERRDHKNARLPIYNDA